MKINFRLLLTSGFFAATSVLLHAGNNTYNWFTDITGDIQFYNAGGLTEIDGSYTFEVGVMSGPITTAESIVSNFRSLNFQTAWDADLGGPGVGGASVSLDYNDLGGYPNGIVAGDVFSVWVYNNKAIAPGSQWVIITNTSWVVTPLATGASVVSADYTITDAGTHYSYGSMDGNKIILATVSAVPEPAAYAALLGVGAMGLVVWRKRRKA